MSDHQPEHQNDDAPSDTDRQPAPAPARDTASDPHEPDFSRLRQARARLDNAFPQD